MPEIIVLIILIVSFMGIVVILVKKIPLLADFTLPEVESKGIMVKIKEKIRNRGFLKDFSSGETMLLKILSKLRILVLKTENRIGCWLSVLRQKSIEKKKCFSDSYWDKLKTKRREKKPKA